MLSSCLPRLRCVIGGCGYVSGGGGGRGRGGGGFPQASRANREVCLSTTSNATYSPAGVRAFDRATKIAQIDRAANYDDPQQYNFLRDLVGDTLIERFDDVQADRTFPSVLDIGGRYGGVVDLAASGRAGVERVTLLSPSQAALANTLSSSPFAAAAVERGSVTTVVGDEEEGLPFETGSFDAVTSVLAMHWVNDLPKLLSEINRVLKPDGLFLGALLGGDTLSELRIALQLAELERDGGISAHVSPLAGSSDLAGLLPAAGFQLTAVELDTLVFQYSSMFALCDDLSGMAESNAVLSRRPYTPRDTFVAAAAAYSTIFGGETGSGGGGPGGAGETRHSVPATFQVLYCSGWTKHESQPKPSRRGSATASLHEIDTLPNPMPPK